MNPVLLGFAKLYNLVPGMGSIIEYLAPAAEPTLVPGQCEKESAEPHPAQYKRALDDGAGQATSNDIPKSPILDHRPAPTIVHDRQHILTPPPAIEPFTNVYHCAACTKEASERRACVCGHANPLAERLIASQREIEDLFSQLKERHIWIDKLQVQLRSAQWQNEDQLHLIANLDRTLHDTQVMLYEQQEHSRRENDLQRQELEIARRFLQRSDTLSEADVKGQVMKLNEEVFQIATSLVDEILDGGGSDIGDSTSVDGPDALTIERLVGSPVVRALEESRIGEGAYDAALQSAVIICLIRHVASVVQSWCPSSSGNAIHCETAYRRLLQEEGANVARQWRAMTRRSLRVAEQEKRELCAQFAGSVCRDLVTLLGFCQQLGIRGDRIDFEPYRERLAYVAELAIELNESVGFGVSSVDLTVFTVQMGQNFDRPSMRDFWSDPVESTSACDQPKEDTVVGTCALGLKREGSSGDGEKAASVGLVLLPASIVLQSALHPDPHA